MAAVLLLTEGVLGRKMNLASVLHLMTLTLFVLVFTSTENASANSIKAWLKNSCISKRSPSACSRFGKEFGQASLPNSDDYPVHKVSCSLNFSGQSCSAIGVGYIKLNNYSRATKYFEKGCHLSDRRSCQALSFLSFRGSQKKTNQITN